MITRNCFLSQDGELVAALGGSGGMHIIPAVLQVFLNSFVLKMKPLQAVESARVYHKVKLHIFQNHQIYNISKEILIAF